MIIRSIHHRGLRWLIEADRVNLGDYSNGYRRH